MIAAHRVGPVTIEEGERVGKIKVEGVDDSVTTWLVSQCLEQGGGRGGGVVVMVVGVKMLRWS